MLLARSSIRFDAKLLLVCSVQGLYWFLLKRSFDKHLALLTLPDKFRVLLQLSTASLTLNMEVAIYPQQFHISVTVIPNCDVCNTSVLKLLLNCINRSSKLLFEPYLICGKWNTGIHFELLVSLE